MADKIKVDVTGKSLYEVAESMATTILISIENKSWSKITRQEYLDTMLQCIRTLHGLPPE